MADIKPGKINELTTWNGTLMQDELYDLCTQLKEKASNEVNGATYFTKEPENIC